MLRQRPDAQLRAGHLLWLIVAQSEDIALLLDASRRAYVFSAAGANPDVIARRGVGCLMAGRANFVGHKLFSSLCYALIIAEEGGIFCCSLSPKATKFLLFLRFFAALQQLPPLALQRQARPLSIASLQKTSCKRQRQKEKTKKCSFWLHFSQVLFALFWRLLNKARSSIG